MCMGSKAPPAPVAPPAPKVEQITQADATAQDSITNEVQKEKLKAGPKTILTSPLGVTENASLQKKTLLGR